MEVGQGPNWDCSAKEKSVSYILKSMDFFTYIIHTMIICYITAQIVQLQYRIVCGVIMFLRRINKP
jgi:hypothetical protein